MSEHKREFSGTDRFRVVKRLGAGGMGEVFEAHDRELDTRVAIKTLARVDARSLRRFKREFRILQDLQHPNLVSLGELFEHAGAWFFSMELVTGVDFLSYVRRSPARTQTTAGVSAHDKTVRAGQLTGSDKRLVGTRASGAVYDEPKLRGCAAQLARAMCALHDCGIVHRDLKPSNILVTPDERVVLLDFGVALEQRPADSSTHAEAVGTVAYMAPEQAVSGAVGPAADWYAYGVLLYEALTGHLPYSGSTSFELLLNKQSYAPPSPKTFSSDIPADLTDLCTDLLAITPGDRPAGKRVLERLGMRDTSDDAAQARVITTVGTQTGPFVGRADELAALRTAFTNTRNGLAQTVLVEGESGIGKSTLIREFTEAMCDVDDSVVVLSGRCYERESVPFKAFDGVIDSLARYMRRLSETDVRALVPRHAALLPRVFPALGRVEAIAESTTRLNTNDALELRRRAFASLRELLHLLAERHPLVLAIDDLQWSDSDSQLLLEDLLQPPDPPPLLLLATARGVGDPDNRAAALLWQWDAHLELEPLKPDEARELAELLLARAHVRAASADHIASEALGHPLYMDELVRHASMAAGDERRLRLDDAIRARVAALPSDARRVLEMSAVAETPVRRVDLAEATRLEMPKFDKQLSILRLGNLVRTSGRRAADTVEPYHDRVREAVIAGLDNDAKQAAHQRLAFVLEGAPGAPAQLVLRHLEAAGQTEKAAGFAETAAQQAARKLAFDRAAELYSAAIRLGTLDPEHRRRLALAQAEALVNAGRGPEAAELFLAAAKDADPATRLACRRQAAEQLIVTGHVERGLGVLAELLGEIGVPLPQTPRAALTSVLWHRAMLRLRGLSFRLRHETELAEQQLMRLDVLRTAGVGLSMIDPVRGAAFNARHLRVTLAAGERSRLVPAVGMEASYLASQGGRGIRRAKTILERVRQLADDPYLTAWAFSIDGVIAYFEGRFNSASETMARATNLFRELPGATWELNNAQIFNLFALRQGGQIVAFRKLYATAVRDARRRGDRYVETTARRYGNFLWLADDDPQGATADLERASWTPPAGRFHLQHWYDLEARAEVALYRGDAAEALEQYGPMFEPVERSLQMRVQAIGARVRWLRGRLHLAAAIARGDDSDHRLVGKICRRLEKEATGYVNVYAALLQAALADQTGRRDKALAQLRRAIDEAGEAMPLHAACARRQLGIMLGGTAGAEMVREADDWMRAATIGAPAKLARVIACGFRLADDSHASANGTT